MDVTIKPLVTSEAKRLRDVLIVAKSDNLLLSRACFKSSAGLRVIITTTERMATSAKTTNNSINVNDERGLPRRSPFGAKSSISVNDLLCMFSDLLFIRRFVLIGNFVIH